MGKYIIAVHLSALQWLWHLKILNVPKQRIHCRVKILCLLMLNIIGKTIISLYYMN